MQRRVDIWHNILWSGYKAAVFSALHKLVSSEGLDLRFFQIAETEQMRLDLGSVDLSRHAYPFTLLFHGAYEAVPLPKMLFKIALATYRSDAELVILSGYSRPENWVQLAILLLKGKKVAVFCDSTILDRKQTRLKSLLKNFFFKRIDGAFCYGERSRQYLKLMGADERNIFTRCQACALPDGYVPEKAVANRAEKAPTASNPRFLYVGRLSPEKDLQTLLKAFAIARPRVGGSLVFVGAGPERGALEKFASDLKISDAVKFAGSMPLDKLADEYARATCLVLPSRSEPWGLVVNEALAQGCPVIVSDACGCVPELVVPGQTGFSFPTGDAVNLASKMEASISTFADARKTAAECVHHINSFSPEKAGSQIKYGIERMLKASPA